MQTRFNIGDTVLIRGQVRRIEITKEGEIYYDVVNENDGHMSYGYYKLKETEILAKEESKDDSVY